MIKIITKITILITAIAIATGALAQNSEKQIKQPRGTIKLGAEISKRDSLEKKDKRGLSQHLIIPKGEWQLGAQISHVSMSSDNSEYMLLLKNINANGSITKVAPFVAYSYHDNRSIGLRFQYTSASGNVQDGDLDLLSDDLNFHVENIHADMTSVQTAVYHRSYIGVDNKGRIGLFSDIMLGYTSSKTKFIYNEQTQDTYTKTDQIKLSLHPGIVVFAMNNISTHVSMGIGGISYNHTKYIKNGETIGTRDYSKANFRLDILDISIGLSIHL
ncbi:MAG: hypothetical protein IKJ48_00875 [Alistipes sp.]|nr:hypothetical protein [Alistipes sp.]